ADMSKEKKSLDSSIIAALIGVVGTIIVTLITLNANRPTPQPQATPFPTWTVPPTATITNTPVPTDTVPAGDPSSTPAPETPTPEPSVTPAPPEIGADWVNNCISGRWVVYGLSLQPDQENGCLIRPVDKFYTSSGHLAFTFADRVSSAQIYGLFAQLPADGTASLKFHLTEVSKGEVLIGIFSEPDANSRGMFLVIPSGNDVKKQKMLIRTMPNKDTFAQSNGPISSDSATYDVVFDYNEGSVSVKLKNNQINLGSVPMSSPNKWLFLGYQVLNGTNHLQADFFDLSVQPR
ncbi:MAG TPA: hypothetical protein VK249_27580, partial [Anaerolineales bacterium]|nr:hypothetical protein [Anaerolineales bacterium]